MSVGLVAVRLLYRFYVFDHLSKWFTFFRLCASLSAVSFRFTLADNICGYSNPTSLLHLYRHCPQGYGLLWKPN